MAKRKPLEGIEELMFVLGSILGLWLATQSYSWWIIILIIIIAAASLGKFVDFLRNKNK